MLHFGTTKLVSLIHRTINVIPFGQVTAETKWTVALLLLFI